MFFKKFRSLKEIPDPTPPCPSLIHYCELPPGHKGRHRVGGTNQNSGNAVIFWIVRDDGNVESTTMSKFYLEE